jgi:hypothetical protein
VLLVVVRIAVLADQLHRIPQAVGRDDRVLGVARKPCLARMSLIESSGSAARIALPDPMRGSDAGCRASPASA